MTGEPRRNLWGQPERAIAALLLAGGLMLTGCSVFQLSAPLRVQEGDWTTEGGSAARTNATDRTLRPPLEEAWTYDADGAFGPAAAVIADDVVIVVTRKGEVRAIGLEDGRKRSIGDFREPIEGAPVVTRRVLYATVAAGKRTIIAHDFVDGRRKWALRAGPHDAGLLLADSTLIAAGRDGAIRAIALSDGAIRWQATPDSAASYFATPVALRSASLASGLVAVADDRGRVTAFDLATGTAHWTQFLGTPVYETPAARDGRLFVPTTRGQFVALDVATGEPLWTTDVADATVRFSAPAVDGGLVVVGASDGRLRALDVARGEPVWTFLADGNFASAPLLAGAVVYAGSLDEHVYAFDRATGDVLWQHELGGRVKSTPLVYGDRLIVLAEPRHVHVFQPASPVAASNE